jgi:hypothetical protein
MFSNQPSWSGCFGFMVTLPIYGAGGPGLVPALGICDVTLSLILHCGLVQPVVQHGFVGAGGPGLDSPTRW